MSDLPFPELGNSEVGLTFIEGEITKLKIFEKASHDTATLLDEGERSPLDAYIKLKALAEYASEAGKLLHDAALDEANRYTKGDNVMHGVVFEEGVAGVRYKYDHDETWQELKDKLKQREEQMKSGMGTAGVVDKETGEVVAPAEKTHGKTTLKISMPKA